MGAKAKLGKPNIKEFELFLPEDMDIDEELEIYESTTGRVEAKVHAMKIQYGIYGN